MDKRKPPGFRGAASVATKLASGVMLAVQVLEPFSGNVRVNLGR